MAGKRFTKTKLALFMSIKIKQLCKKTATASFFVLFLAANAYIIASLYTYSLNMMNELYKFLQLALSLMLVAVLLKKINKFLAFTVIFICSVSYLLLSEYKIITRTLLDFNFLKHNLENLRFVLPTYTKALLLIVFLGCVNAVAFYKITVNSKKIFLFLIILTVTVAVYPSIIGRSDLDNELIAFAKSVYVSDKIIDYYQDYYSHLILKSANNKKRLIDLAKKIRQNRQKNFLNNIIFLQLESVNGFLINTSTAPTLMSLAKRGIFFPVFYGNGIMTIYGQENILCSMPNSFYLGLVRAKTDKKIICLPEIMNNLGYKTFFFKSYNLKFAKTGEFMKNLHFNEVLAENIMRTKDTRYSWGYEENIFYKRVFDYLKKNKSKKNFIYIEVGPTNHWPFNIPPERSKDALFPSPKNYKEKISNTLYFQDRSLATAWKRINEIFPKQNYTLFILSDHGWPAGMRKLKNGASNIFNQQGSYEENFRSFLLVIFGGKNKYAGKTVRARHSNMDIMPSVLSLLGVDYSPNKFSSSFADELFGKKQKNPLSVLLIQPYGEKYINIINKNVKYQYSSRSKTFIEYDLTKDAIEKHGQIIGSNDDENLKILKNLLGY